MLKSKPAHKGENTALFTNETIMFMMDKVKFSERVYDTKLRTENVQRYDFIFLLNNISPYFIFPHGILMTFNPTENFTTLDPFLKESSNMMQMDICLKESNKIRKKMLLKTQEFEKCTEKLPKDYHPTDEIYYNFARYEIRDYIEQHMNGEMVTNAWVKMYELLSVAVNNTFLTENPVIKTFHMCELPGAFIAATNHFIKTNSTAKFEWTAQSLFDKSNVKMIDDQYGLYQNNKDNYDFGSTQNGDLINKKNVVYYIDKYKDVNFGIITSDCGECKEENIQMKEDQMWSLQWHQFIIGMNLKTIFYICKLYSAYNENTMKLIMLATLFFKRVKLHRPFTTKIESDEMYLVCKFPKENYGVARQLIDLDINKIFLQKSFCKRIGKFSLIAYLRRVLGINYMLFIQNNMEYIKQYNDRYKNEYNHVRVFHNTTRITRNYFVKSYVHGTLMVKPIDDSQKLMPNKKSKNKSKWSHNFSLKTEFVNKK